MKKILQFLGLTIVSSSVFAQTQVPNADFENWTLEKPAYSYYSADNWSDGAACASVNGGTESCQFVNKRTTAAQSGTYAIQYFDLAPQFGTKINTLPFWNLDENFSGPAFTGRPASVSFYYKYSTDDNQLLDIEFDLYSGSATNPTLIGTAKYEFSTVQKTYKKVDAIFTYNTSTTPTNIMISSDYGDHTPATALDTLTLDNIVFNYGVATDVTNPTSPDYFTVAVSNKVLSTSKSIDNAVLVDLAGKNAASFNQGGTVFNVEQLKTGIYILTGMVNDTPFSRKVIIE